MTLDDDDKKWVRNEIGMVRSELREEIAGVRREVNELRAEVRGGFEGMTVAFAEMATNMTTAITAGISAAIENQTRVIVDALVHERVESLIKPAGNGKPPKDGGGEKT